MPGLFPDLPQTSLLPVASDERVAMTGQARRQDVAASRSQRRVLSQHARVQLTQGRSGDLMPWSAAEHRPGPLERLKGGSLLAVPVERQDEQLP